MSKQAKQIIVILILLTGLSAFFAVANYTKKQSLEQSKISLEQQLVKYETERNQLEQAAQNLEDQLRKNEKSKDRLEQELRRFNDQVDSLRSQINQLSADRDSWKNRLEGLRKERDELMAKLQEKPRAMSTPAPVRTMASTGRSSSSTLLSEGEEKQWAEALKSKATLEIELQKIKDTISDKAVKVEELKKKNSDLELELSALRSEKEETEQQLQTRVKHSEELANNLAIELAREKSEKKPLVGRIVKLKEENKQFRAQIKRLTSTKIGLERNIAKLSANKTKIEKKLRATEGLIENQVSEIIALKDDLSQKLAGFGSVKTHQVELPPIIVNAPGSSGVHSSSSAMINEMPAMDSGMRGSILSVNTGNNFVVVDRGQKDGVQIGDRLSVYRNDRYIATIEVIQVRGDISAADIKQQSVTIQSGDTVK